MTSSAVQSCIHLLRAPAFETAIPLSRMTKPTPEWILDWASLNAKECQFTHFIGRVNYLTFKS